MVYIVILRATNQKINFKMELKIKGIKIIH